MRTNWWPVYRYQFGKLYIVCLFLVFILSSVSRRNVILLKDWRVGAYSAMGESSTLFFFEWSLLLSPAHLWILFLGRIFPVHTFKLDLFWCTIYEFFHLSHRLRLPELWVPFFFGSLSRFVFHILALTFLFSSSLVTLSISPATWISEDAHIPFRQIWLPLFQWHRFCASSFSEPWWSFSLPGMGVCGSLESAHGNDFPFRFRFGAGNTGVPVEPNVKLNGLNLPIPVPTSAVRVQRPNRKCKRPWHW